MTTEPATFFPAPTNSFSAPDSTPEGAAPTIEERITDLIVRTDPDAAAICLPDEHPLTMLRTLIVSVWRPAAPDDAVLDTMTAVLDRHLAALAADGHTDLHRADKHAIRFVEAAPTPNVWHLRRNTLIAAYSALRNLGAHPGPAPVTGLRPHKLEDGEPKVKKDKGKKDKGKQGKEHRKDRDRARGKGEGKNKKKGKSGRDKAIAAKSRVVQPRNRVATSDEVLTARVCARLDVTGALHRRAAALAIACAGAATGEGAQACWTHHTRTEQGAPGQLELAGRHHHNPTSGWHIKRRTVTLDPWSTTALQDWREEAGSADRPLAQEWSIVYDGTKALTHQSAKNSYDHHINLTLDAADLSWIPGLTAMSIGEWAAAHAIIHHPGGLSAGADVMGVDPLNCLRRLTKASTRAYKPL